MTSDQRAHLAAIRTFDQLIGYLRDWMGWPIDGDDLEELTFEYTPEELGIDPKNAAAILSIKRLRPLSAAQPWGIFFVEFEPKRLPVLALRRILSRVALKKRASANRADQAAWAADDLLFISAHGAGDDRQITFAHFAPAQDGRDLPTLKVLGWDSRDTVLHLDGVARELTQNLAWPDDENNAAAWRASWRDAFKLGHREVVTTSKDLAIRLAALARVIRDRIKAALAIETETGPLTKLMKAFREALVHDLDAEGFADMYAQTIAYGLLSARITDPKRSTLDDFAAHMRTNPFLRELMQAFLEAGGRRGEAGLDFDELGFSDVVGLLDRANMDAVVRDFGDRNPQEDPVIHFYEAFLREYDNDQKVKRGVFYTPRPVVSYIVRSVDELLRAEFGLEDGLADTTSWGEMAKRHQDLTIPEGVSPEQDFVQILDPATGTGTFLVEVIDVIHKTLVSKWKAQGHGEKQIDALWNAYVPKHLLTRLHGYELLMAPYAIAHLKIGLKLYETGYRFDSDERARVFLTNALEPPSGRQLTFDFLPALAHEAEAVNEIKLKQRFTIAVGNPPYSVSSQNDGKWIREISSSFKKDLQGEKNTQPLSDDYIKFIALGVHTLISAGIGIQGMITNREFIQGIIHRSMRKQIFNSSKYIKIMDLHGQRVELLASSADDQNVFDIEKGVAIHLFVFSHRNDRRIEYSEIIGLRSKKISSLLSEVDCFPTHKLSPDTPFFLFKPYDDQYREEYLKMYSLKDIFPSLPVTGFATHRDHFAIAFSREEVEERVRRFIDPSMPDAVIAEKFKLKNTRDWDLSRSRLKAKKDLMIFGKIIKFLYRPFDVRWVIFSDDILEYSRRGTMENISPHSPALICSRIAKDEIFAHVFISTMPVEKIFLSPKSSNNAQILTSRDELLHADSPFFVQYRAGQSASELVLNDINMAYPFRSGSSKCGRSAVDVPYMFWYTREHGQSLEARSPDVADGVRSPFSGRRRVRAPSCRAAMV